MSQQSLRNAQSNLRSSSRTQQLQRKAEQVRQKQEQQRIETEKKTIEIQKQTISQKIKELQSKASQSQSILKEGRSLAGERDYEKAQAEQKNINYQLTELKKLESGLSGGSYYKDFDKVIKNVSATGARIQEQKYQSWSSSKSVREAKAGTGLPEGAKIVSTTFKNGERIITYELPGQKQTPVTSESKQEVVQTPSQVKVLTGSNLGGTGTIYLTPEETSSKTYKKLTKKTGDTVSVVEKSQNVLTTTGTKSVGTGVSNKVIVKSGDITNTSGGTYQVTTKATNQGRETYSPLFGGYVKATEASGSEYSKGTVQVRQPTIQEQRQIEKYTRGNNIMVTSTKELSKDIKEVKQLQSKIENLEKGNIKDGEWIGNEKDYQEYSNAFKKLETIDQTVRTGVGKGKFSREVSIFSFDFENKPVSSTFKVFGSSAGSILGGVGETLGKEEGYVQKDFKLFTPQFGTQQVDTKAEITSFSLVEDEIKPFSLMGNTEFTKIEDKKLSSYSPIELRYGTKEGLRKAGEIIGEQGFAFGKYLTPAGSLIFGAEVAEYGFGVRKTIKSGEKLTKEQKVEGIVLGGIVLTGGILRGAKVIKNLRVARTESELTKLGQQPLRYLEVVDKETNLVKVRAFQKYNKLERQIDILGELKKTKEGTMFLPKAEGVSITTGKIGKKNVVEIVKFETGAKSVSIPIESKNNLVLYLDISRSRFDPTISTYATFGKGEKGIKFAEKQLKENIVIGGNKAVDISGTQTLMKGKNIGLTYGEDILGLKVIKEAEQGTKYGIKITGGKKTPLSKTFGIQTVEKQNINIKQVKTELGKPTLKTPELKLDLVKPSVKESSIYAGTGQYERTKEVSSMSPIQMPSITSNVKVESKEILNVKPFERTKEAITIKEKDRSKTVDIIKPLQKEFSKEAVKEKLKTNQILKSLLESKEEQQFDFKQKQKSVISPIEDKIKIPIKIKGSSNMLNRLSKKAEEGSLFEAFAFQKGKQISVKKGTEVETSLALKKFLKGELSASGFLTKGGKKIKAKETSLLKDIEFRVGKRDPFLIVEKKEKRLRKGTTGEQVQFFRKGTKKKTKNNLFGIGGL